MGGCPSNRNRRPPVESEAMAATTLDVAGQTYEVFRLPDGSERLPYTLRILLENVLRHGEQADADAISGWQPQAEPSQDISFRPARVLHQDFTGVPAIVDLAAMRNAMQDLGGDPSRINPQLPSELVIDHSVQVDEYASAGARARSTTSRSSRRTRASSTRSTSSSWPASSRRATVRRFRTRCSARIPIRR